MTETDDGSGQRDCSETEEFAGSGYIVAIIVLALLSAGLLLSTFIVYFKLRSERTYTSVPGTTVVLFVEAINLTAKWKRNLLQVTLRRTYELLQLQSGIYFKIIAVLL